MAASCFELPSALPPQALQQLEQKNNKIVRLKLDRTLALDPGVQLAEVSYFPLRQSIPCPTPIAMLSKFRYQGRQSYQATELNRHNRNRLPYSLPRDSQSRYFMSGFSGHVPQVRFQYGTGYPVATHNALEVFDGKGRWNFGHQSNESNQTNLSNADKLMVASGSYRDRSSSTSNESTIYRRTEGLLPNYGGFVPGQRFRFGGPFGRITINARRIP